MRYTKKMHAEALLILLSNEKPCSLCPGDIARLLFDPDSAVTDHCSVCTHFVRKRSEIIPGCDYAHTSVPNKCPCYKFGKEEAIKRTWIALETNGYLDTNEEDI